MNSILILALASFNPTISLIELLTTALPLLKNEPFLQSGTQLSSLLALIFITVMSLAALVVADALVAQSASLRSSLASAVTRLISKLITVRARRFLRETGCGVSSKLLYMLGLPVSIDFSRGVASEANANFADDYGFITALIEQDGVASLKYGVLFLLALSSLGVYSIILAGWSSNSKYAFIGALRSAAQMISYEVAISLIILPVVIFCGSLDLTMITYVQHITDWLSWPLLPIAQLFLIAMLAETNRTPFDLPEAEAELVAGYNVDYSSLPFAMFFLGEYCNMILISTMFCLLFLSGGLNKVSIPSQIMLSLKAAVTWVFFVLVRATLPRYRYDQLMDIGWKVFLPTSGSFLLFVFGILVFFIALPVTNELPLFVSVAEPALMNIHSNDLVADDDFIDKLLFNIPEPETPGSRLLEWVKSVVE